MKPFDIFKHNYQRCDIAWTHNGKAKGIGARHFNFKNQLWNTSPESYVMHDKAKFYNLLK